jgi:hypothetical protein
MERKACGSSAGRRTRNATHMSLIYNGVAMLRFRPSIVLNKYASQASRIACECDRDGGAIMTLIARQEDHQHEE